MDRILNIQLLVFRTGKHSKCNTSVCYLNILVRYVISINVINVTGYLFRYQDTLNILF